MNSEKLPMIDVARLQLGIYVVLELGWRQHPFAFNSFTLRNEEQLAQLRSLGLRQVRYCPDRSVVAPLPAPAVHEPVFTRGPDAPTATPAPVVHFDSQTPLQRQEASLKLVEAEYLKVTQQHQQLVKQLATEPQQARQSLEQLGVSMSEWMTDGRELTIRLLTQRSADTPSAHEVGVTVLSLLLARDCGFSRSELQELAVAGLLHDIGKTKLPAFLREDSGRLNDFERKSYRSHVPLGVELAESLGLSRAVVRAISEHHEHSDGSGFPVALSGEQISPPGRVLAIVNRYQTLVCPLNAYAGLSPHAALQQMYGRERAHYDPVLFPRFVRMMGVYPPGTVVELTDQRMAIVVATRPGMSLAPRVQVIDRPDQQEPSLAMDVDLDSGISVRCALRTPDPNSPWAQRSRQLARAAFFVEPLEAQARSVAA